MLKHDEYCYGASVSRWTRLHTRLNRACFLTLAGLICACTQSHQSSSMQEAADEPVDSSKPSNSAPPNEADDDVDEEEQFKFTEAFRLEPSVDRLLGLLVQSHHDARDALGPHHLHYVAQFQFGSAELPAERPSNLAKPKTTANSKADASNRVDQLDLFWYGPNTREQRFMLSQHNDSGTSREITVDGLKVYSRIDRPKWFVRQLENDLHEIWLNDAQRAVYDAVELAAGQLKIEDVQIVQDRNWGKALDIPLSYQARTTPVEQQDGANPAAKWRKDLKIDQIAGVLRLQRTHGIWIWADIDVRYHVNHREGRKFFGRLALQANTAPIDRQTHPFSLPKSFLALPERHRYVFEQQQMLKGLARP